MVCVCKLAERGMREEKKASLVADCVYMIEYILICGWRKLAEPGELEWMEVGMRRMRRPEDPTHN